VLLSRKNSLRWHFATIEKELLQCLEALSNGKIKGATWA
jgi:hypothetical protein